MLNFILSFIILFSGGLQSGVQKTLNKKNPKYVQKYVSQFVVLRYQTDIYMLSGTQASQFLVDIMKELPVKKARVIKAKRKKSHNPLHVSPNRYSHYILFHIHNEHGGIDKVRLYLVTYHDKIIQMRLE